jgi:hypothetical protein
VLAWPSCSASHGAYHFLACWLGFRGLLLVVNLLRHNNCVRTHMGITLLDKMFLQLIDSSFGRTIWVPSVTVFGLLMLTFLAFLRIAAESSFHYYPFRAFPLENDKTEETVRNTCHSALVSCRLSKFLGWNVFRS